jgi:hypothetical protein
MTSDKTYQNRSQEKLGTGTYSLLKYTCASQVLVAHTYNPSYLGGTHQEDCILKSAQANSL